MLTSDFILNTAVSRHAHTGADAPTINYLDLANIPASLQKFGGDGSDGPLNVSSGTTSIDLGAASIVIKNYTSISITGTGVLAFSNPATTGTIIILKSQGDVVLTSTATALIDASGMGGAGGAAVTNSNGNDGSVGRSYTSSNFGGRGTSTAQGTGGAALNTLLSVIGKIIPVYPGAGGGSGNSTSVQSSGAGARGGGALIIESKGSLNFTGTIFSKGSAGTVGDSFEGRGGGGGGGIVAVLYNILTANTGTITTTGGTGGTAGGGGNKSGGGGGSLNAGTDGVANTGGTGGDGGSFVAENLEFA